MTEPAAGPSFAQVPRNTGQGQHHHQHRHLAHDYHHHHHHHHARFFPAKPASNLAPGTQPDADGQHRSSQSSSGPPDTRSPKEDRFIEKRVIVHETKTVVQYVDESGAVTSVSTITSPLVTESAADEAGASVTTGSDDSASAATTAASTALSTPTPSRAPSTESQPLTVSVSLGVGITLDAPSSTSDSASLTTTSSSSYLFFNTSSIVTSSSSRATLLGPYGSNSTVSWGSHYSNSSKSIWQLSSSTQSSRTHLRTSTYTGSYASLTSADSSEATATFGVATGGADESGSAPGASPTSTSTDTSDGSGLNKTEQSAIIATVTGVAGIAIFSFLLLLFIKWKKRRGGHIRLLGDARGGGGTDGSGGSGSDAMAQQRSLPFLGKGALAAMMGLRTPQDTGAPGGSGSGPERGFVRISGRKLIQSAIESGGDGYSDPPSHRNASIPQVRNDDVHEAHHDVRNSVISEGGASSFYNRGSSIFWDGTAGESTSLQPPGKPSRLQLNSPIRPVSGELFVRDSPARTPHQELSPFADPVPQTPPPGPPPLTPLPTPPSAAKKFMAGKGGTGSRGPGGTDTMDWAVSSSQPVLMASLSRQPTTPRFREGM